MRIVITEEQLMRITESVMYDVDEVININHVRKSQDKIASDTKDKAMERAH